MRTGKAKIAMLWIVFARSIKGAHNREVFWQYLIVLRKPPLNRVSSQSQSRFEAAPERKELTYRLGILGAVIPRKRIFELILAFKELRECLPEYDLKLSVVGSMEGEYPEFVKDMIKRLDLKDKVVLEGPLDDIVTWYNNIDIIISHSMHEGAHLAIHEGKACGCYPIAFWWDGVEEFLRKDQLYITNPEFCERIRNFYDMSDARRKTLRKEGRDYVVNTFSLPIISKQFQKLFEDMAR